MLKNELMGAEPVNGPRGAGTPGYPVPVELKPDDENEDNKSKIESLIEYLFTSVVESLQGGSFTSTGGAPSPSYGSSGWSSGMNNLTPEDEEGQGLWQLYLPRMLPVGKSALP